MEYKIWEGNFENFDKKMKRIVKKSEKYPECNIQYDVLGDVYEKREIDGRKNVYRFIKVDVEGTVINNGWRFVATLEHNVIDGETRNVVRQADTTLELPRKFYTCECECEHCKQRRRRKDTYIVYNENTGDFKQVGKTCLKEYTKGLSAESVACLAEIIQTAEDMEERTGYWDASDYVELKRILQLEEPLVKMEGYISNSKAEKIHEYSTKVKVQALYLYYNDKMLCHGWQYDIAEGLIENGYNPDNADKDFVEDALNWIRESEANDCYLNNLQVICSKEYIDLYKDLGIAVSLLSAYYKALNNIKEKERRKEEGKQSKFLGEIGEKIVFRPVTKQIVAEYKTMYGLQRIYKFTDVENNVLVWKTSAFIDNLEDNIQIKGTVKEHNFYRGIRQTQLSRCKVI